jgi:hypothetical protein
MVKKMKTFVYQLPGPHSRPAWLLGHMVARTVT